MRSPHARRLLSLSVSSSSSNNRPTDRFGVDRALLAVRRPEIEGGSHRKNGQNNSTQFELLL